MPKCKITKTQKGDISTITVVEYVPDKEELQSQGLFSSRRLPAGLHARDVCGDGTDEFKHNSPLAVWKQPFPVLYFIESSVPSSLVQGVVDSFNAFNHVAGFPLYSRTNSSSSAKIKVSFAVIDRSGSTLARAEWSWRTSTLGLIDAEITFDSRDSWKILTNESCGANGSTFDLINVAVHEIGHLSGLGHAPTDKLQTMFATTSPGATLGRSLGNGDIKGFKTAYNITTPPPPPPPEPEPEPITTQPKVTTIGATTYLNLAYENIDGKYVPITTLTGSHSLPFDGLHAKRITISGTTYVYLYYYRAANLFTTLGRIPLS